jgi:hypothetical protein
MPLAKKLVRQAQAATLLDNRSFKGVVDHVPDELAVDFQIISTQTCSQILVDVNVQAGCGQTADPSGRPAPPTHPPEGWYVRRMRRRGMSQ